MSLNDNSIPWDASNLGWSSTTSTWDDVSSNAISWDNAGFTWSSNPYTWNDVKFITEIVRKGGGNPELIKRIIDSEEEEKKKFIEVIVKVKGNQEYSSPHIYNQKKPIDGKYDVTVDDIKMVVGEVLNITLEVKNINV